MVIAFVLFFLGLFLFAADGQCVAINGNVDVFGLTAGNFSPYYDGVVFVGNIDCVPRLKKPLF